MVRLTIWIRVGQETREGCLFDGTMYSLTASWVADPTRAMLQEAGVQTSPEKVEVSDKEVNTPQFYNAWSIGEKCVDTSDLFLSQSPTKDTKPNICVLDETIIDLTMSDQILPAKQLQQQNQMNPM